jgi:hypothetical protein
VLGAGLVVGAFLLTTGGCLAQKAEPADQGQAKPPLGSPAPQKQVIPRVEKPVGPKVDKSLMYPPSVADDCPPATKYPEGGADGSARYCLAVAQRAQKRCETAYYDFIKRDTDTTIGFDFRLDTSWDFHDIWTSIFQVHSHPDEGEQWRCPISALEVLGHTLRMYNRYDMTPISVTKNGTCAEPGNSIHDRPVFEGVPVQAGQWNHFELNTKLSLDEKAAHFTTKLNGKVIGSVTGPNTYNDFHQPFLKIGIYKPSPWAQAKQLCVDYRNVSIPTAPR